MYCITKWFHILLPHAVFCLCFWKIHPLTHWRIDSCARTLSLACILSLALKANGHCDVQAVHCKRQFSLPSQFSWSLSTERRISWLEFRYLIQMRFVFMWSGLFCLMLLAVFPGEGPGEIFFILARSFQLWAKTLTALHELLGRA